MVPYDETKKFTYFLNKVNFHTRNDQPSGKKLMLVARSIKMAMVPSMVPYYYMQMQQRIKHENEFDWHTKVRERQGVGEKLTD